MRPRYLVTPTILLYGAGRPAHGLTHLNAVATQDVTSAIRDKVGAGGASKSAFQLQWKADGGGEWMLTNKWSLKTEYLYYDLGTTSIYLGQGPRIQGIQKATSDISDGQIVQICNAYANTCLLAPSPAPG